MADTATIETPPAAVSAPVTEGQAPAATPAPRMRREGGGGGRGGRDFRTRRKVCVFCVEKIKDIDYKDTGRLRRFISDRGKIDPRRRTGTCAKHQRKLAVALKRARFMALLPYTGEHIRSIESGGHGGHGERRDVGRPDRSTVSTPEAAAPEGAVDAAVMAETAQTEVTSTEVQAQPDPAAEGRGADASATEGGESEQPAPAGV